jgi:hypothetical protein
VRRIERSGRITTIAGNGATGFPASGEIATHQPLWSPESVAVDGAGTVYIAIPGRVYRVGFDGRIVHVAGGGNGVPEGGQATSAYVNPSALAVGPLGTLFIADWAASRIWEVRRDGTIHTVMGPDVLDSPRGLGFDPFGNLYVADTGNGVVRKRSPLGVVSTVLEGWMPWAVASDALGRLYVSDAAPSAVTRIGLTGTTEVLPGHFSWPRSLAVTNDGRVWVAQPLSSRVRTIATDAVTLPELSVSVVAGNASVRVALPGATPGAYTVEARVKGTTQVVAGVTVGGDATGTSLAGLRNGTTYDITVTARTATGIARISDAITATPSAVWARAHAPGRPAAAAVTGVGRGVSVTWTPPADDGGSPVTAYSVIVTDPVTGLLRAWRNAAADARQLSVDGLTPGVTYAATVVAWSGIGVSAPTQAGTATPGRGLPTAASAPSLAWVFPFLGSRAVVWSPPLDDGGRPVTSYTVVVLRGATVLSWTNAAATARWAVLPAGTPADATVLVTAYTAAGPGLSLAPVPAS